MNSLYFFLWNRRWYFFLQEMRIHCCLKCSYLSDKDFLLVALFSLCNISSTVQPLDFFWFSFLEFSFHSGFLPIFLLPIHTQSSSFLRSTEAHLRNCPPLFTECDVVKQSKIINLPTDRVSMWLAQIIGSICTIFYHDVSLSLCSILLWYLLTIPCTFRPNPQNQSG